MVAIGSTALRVEVLLQKCRGYTLLLLKGIFRTHKESERKREI